MGWVVWLGLWRGRWVGGLAEIGGRLGIPGSYFPAQSGLGSASGRGLGCARLCSNGGPGVLGWRATREGSGGRFGIIARQC